MKVFASFVAAALAQVDIRNIGLFQVAYFRTESSQTDGLPIPMHHTVVVKLSLIPQLSANHGTISMEHAL